MTITGTIPSAIAAFLKTENESLNGIEIKGNDIDVILTDKGTYTELYAIGMGNGSYEIMEIDDNLNLLPEYSEGDVISNDVLKKLFSTVINSSLILSFNPLGKIKYGVIDKANNVKNKVKKAGRWIADVVTPEDAQNYIRSLDGFGRAKVGKVERIGGVTGGYYAVLFGNPADKNFYVWKLYRNGNEYRVLDQHSANSGEVALEEFNKMAGIYEEDPYEVNNEGVAEPEYKDAEEVEQSEEPDNLNDIPDEEDNVYDEEGLKYVKMNENTKRDKRKFKKANKSKEGWQTNDEGIEYKVVAALKKKKKKSKYNGCNVTGYEDGTLISPMGVGDGGMAVGS